MDAPTSSTCAGPSSGPCAWCWPAKAIPDRTRRARSSSESTRPSRSRASRCIHAGTAKNFDDELVTAGGRVLNVVALGDSFDDAREKAYEACDLNQLRRQAVPQRLSANALRPSCRLGELNALQNACSRPLFANARRITCASNRRKSDACPAEARPDVTCWYMHVPFCERLCPYCSFNRFPFAEDRARPYFANMPRKCSC